MASKRSRQSFEADLQKRASPFVAYGTALPSLDENTRDDGSFVPVWKQDVTDERGRKRLHGAFTGGFSAGYFNTVGSKEGWTPSAFVSSRNNRAKDLKNPPQQKPEDFMDDEDRQEAEDTRTLQTSEGFTGFGTEHDTLRRSTAMDLFRPSEQTRGVKLLMRMGWKEGQGIGPRIRRTADLGDGSVESVDQHLFAPADIEVTTYSRKTDRKGLGYEAELSESTNVPNRPHKKHTGTLRSGEASEDDDDDEGPRLFQVKKLASRKKKTGFGVGVLDDGSDDEDPYSMGPRISYNRTIGGEKKPKGNPKGGLASANPLLKTKPTFISKRLGNLKASLRKCHDGRLPLDGFVLADELDAFGAMSINDERYRPQKVPDTWSSMLREPSEQNAEYTSTADAAKASSLTAKSRATLLGESQLPGKSVFDYMTPAARDRLATASGRNNLPQAGGEQGPAGFERQLSDIPQLEQDVALQALNRGVSGWMPYAEDESKRARYRAYLEIQAGVAQDEHAGRVPPRAEGMKTEDWVLEMQEFARAAHVFKPISGLMASRFTTSSNLPQEQGGESTEPLLSKPNAKPENPADAAAKVGMFGAMTRSFSNFYPSRLLCKRFSLPPPDHASSATTSGANGAPVGSSAQARLFTAAEVYDEASAGKSHIQESHGQASMDQAANESASTVPPRAIDPDRNDALEREKPGLAVFRAIFGSDDESD